MQTLLAEGMASTLIEIDTFFNNHQVYLEVTRAFSGTYQVWINKYYQGLIMQSADGWIIHFQRDTILQGDDVAVIIEMIEQNL
jgi:hypothetical protein